MTRLRARRNATKASEPDDLLVSITLWKACPEWKSRLLTLAMLDVEKCISNFEDKLYLIFANPDK